MSRDAWLVVHVFGVIVFLGNIIVTGVWKTLADRTREPHVVAYAQRLVIVTDVAFTAVGAALIAVSGPILAEDLGGVGGPAWITWGLALFAASGIIWVAVLLPIQVAQSRLARAFASGGPVPERYWRLSTLWGVFGTVATLLPLVNLYFMIYKPD